MSQDYNDYDGALKFLKHNFKIAFDPKAPTYGRVWRSQTIRGAHGGHANFPIRTPLN